MLKHVNETPETPKRVIGLGASGFLGSVLFRQLSDKGINTLAPSSGELDLSANEAGEQLAGLLAADDVLVMLAALTPDRGRDIATLMKNLKMAENVCGAIASRPPAHVVYISSDAVYPFRSSLVNEETPTEPVDLYGAMHRTRELMFEASCPECPLTIIRPTLLYGPGDTHNSYGPNRFRRVAAETGSITVGGEGEETRDHLFIEDAASLIASVIAHRSAGTLNLASGRSESFRTVAESVAKQFDKPIAVNGSQRGMPVTHRSFDVSVMRRAFPQATFRSLEEGLALAHSDVVASI